MSAADVLLALATTTVGVTAGVMFCYWTAVMPGLHELGDREFVLAFQQIDRKIVNPLFVMVTFLGGAALLVAGTVVEGIDSDRFGLLAAASLLYVIGVVGITVVWHVPRNATLARVAVSHTTSEDVARVRSDFEPSWNRLHGVRTLAAVASLALVAIALAR
jgi:uncharacterized membrane protein